MIEIYIIGFLSAMYWKGIGNSIRNYSDVIGKYSKLAELVKEPVIKAKNVSVNTTNGTKKVQMDKNEKFVREVNKELSKLTPIESKWSVSNDKFSIMSKFMQDSHIWREWSAHNFEKVKELNNEIPEILFIGRCNVGKSSIINLLLSNPTRKNKNIEKFAHVKNEAGYTPCLNFYNIGGKLRIVDSPGYGQKGKKWQGKLVMDYMERRDNLKGVFMVIDGNIGITVHDEMIFEMIESMGISIYVIINKVDKCGGAVDKIVAVAQSIPLKIEPPSFATICKSDVAHGVNVVAQCLFELCGLRNHGDFNNVRVRRSAVEKKLKLKNPMLERREKRLNRKLKNEKLQEEEK